MSSIDLVIVTPERVIYSGVVSAVIAPGAEGELGILPGHAPLMTILQAGELKVKDNDDDIIIAVYSGFLEVRPDRVIVLADAAERAEEIDVVRAGEAKHRAERTLEGSKSLKDDRDRAEAELRRSLIRLKVAGKKRKGKPWAI